MTNTKRKPSIGENGFLKCKCCNIPILMRRNNHINCPICGWQNSFASENKIFTQIRKDFHLIKMHPHAKKLIHSYTNANSPNERLKVLHSLEKNIIWEYKPFIPLYVKNFDFFKNNSLIGKVIRKHSENIDNRHYRYMKTCKKYKFLYDTFVKDNIPMVNSELRLNQIKKLNTAEQITFIQKIYLLSYNPIYDTKYKHIAKTDIPENENAKNTYIFLNTHLKTQNVYKIAILKAEIAFYDREYEYYKCCLVENILKELNNLDPKVELTKAIEAYDSFKIILSEI